jgi:hypothetical protein
MGTVDLTPFDRCDDPLGHHWGLEMGCRAGLRQGQIGGVVELLVRSAADLERRPVGRQPAARRRGEPRIHQELLALRATGHVDGGR